MRQSGVSEARRRNLIAATDLGVGTSHSTPVMLRAFGQEGWSIGLDYERATWLQPEDSQAIVAALRGLHYEVDDGPTAQAILNDFDFSNAR